MEIRKRLIIVGSILLLAALACGDRPDINEFSIASTEQARAGSTLDANSTVTEVVLETARVEATATKAYFETKEALCLSLTREECANLGSYWYTETIVSNRTDCAAPKSPGEVSHTFDFEEGRVQYSRHIAGSVADYTGHTRIATNTYQFTWPGGFPVNTLTFSQNGFVEEHITSEVCTHTYAYTFVE